MKSQRETSEAQREIFKSQREISEAHRECSKVYENLPEPQMSLKQNSYIRPWLEKTVFTYKIFSSNSHLLKHLHLKVILTTIYLTVIRIGQR